MSSEMSLLAYEPRLTIPEAHLVTGIPLRTLHDRVKRKAIPSFKSCNVTYIEVKNVLILITKENQNQKYVK